MITYNLYESIYEIKKNTSSERKYKKKIKCNSRLNYLEYRMYELKTVSVVYTISITTYYNRINSSLKNLQVRSEIFFFIPL